MKRGRPRKNIKQIQDSHIIQETNNPITIELEELEDSQNVKTDSENEIEFYEDAGKKKNSTEDLTYFHNEICLECHDEEELILCGR